MHAMQTPPRWLRWGITGLALPLLMAGLLAAQNPKKPISEDEDPKGKPTKKLPSEDEAPKAKTKKLPSEDDPVKPVKPATVVKPAGDDKIDLAAEAAKAPTTELQGIYRDLAVEYDILRHRVSGDIRVLPVEVYVGNSSNDKDVKYTPLGADNKPAKISSSAAGRNKPRE